MSDHPLYLYRSRTTFMHARLTYSVHGPRFVIFILSLLCLALAPEALSQDVLTYHNNNGRQGLNNAESILTPANVNSGSFGLQFNLPVDGKVDAQPLYASNVVVPGKGTYNLLIAATEHGSVYAFAARLGIKLWQVSTLGSGETPSDSLSCNQVVPEIGITATPVISRTQGPHGAIYVVAMSKDSSGNYHQRLHALDLATGAELFGGPKEIKASYPGNGDNSSNGRVVFDPKQHKARPGLLLLNNVVYTAWGSHCDIRPYTGWLIGYNASTLAQTTVINLAPNGSGAALWMSGAGIAGDPFGNICVMAGNGDFDTNLNANGFPQSGNYGNAFVRLTTAGGLAVADYFTMKNQQQENDNDVDLGSGGVLILPQMKDSSGQIRYLAVGAGKDSNIYLVGRYAMGKFNPNTNNLRQEVNGGLPGGAWSMPALFGNTLYYGSVGRPIYAFQFSNALLSTGPVMQTSNSFGYPGAIPSISSNGTSNAIVWAVENADTAVLHAYNASNLQEIYNSNQATNARDQFGKGNKYITPTIANGQVFVGTPNSVAVFGLR
jgi:mRNA-degrading endonuclease HigB of HigAB toxin-antitoxin module